MRIFLEIGTERSSSFVLGASIHIQEEFIRFRQHQNECKIFSAQSRQLPCCSSRIIAVNGVAPCGSMEALLLLGMLSRTEAHNIYIPCVAQLPLWIARQLAPTFKDVSRFNMHKTKKTHRRSLHATVDSLQQTSMRQYRSYQTMMYAPTFCRRGKWRSKRMI